MTFAIPGMKPLEYASPAITDQLFKMETALPTLIHLLFLKATSSAKYGLEKNALNALIEASSMLMDFAFLLALNAILLIKPQETA